MKRAVMLTMAGAILCLACSSDPESVTPRQPPDLRLSVAPASTTQAQRASIQTFWRLYRAATAARVSGDYARALALFDSSLVLQPDHLDALYYSGNAAYELGDFTEAERRWRRELAANKHSARAHAQLGMLYSSGLPQAPTDLSVARAELIAAHSLNRDETGPLVRLGEVALLAGDHEAAARWLASASMTNTRSVAAVYLRGYFAWSAGDTATAADLLRQARHLAQGGPEEVSASAEGQTRRGHRPLLESGRTSPLAASWNRLFDDTAVDESAAAVEIEYSSFDSNLTRLRTRLRAVSRDGKD